MRQVIDKAKMIKGKAFNAFINFKKRMNWFDIRDGLDTWDCIDVELLTKGIDSPNKKFMVRYSPSGLFQIKSSLGQLIKFDPTVLEHGFIDFGCGKGRVLIMAERMGFRNIVGVEFSKELCAICLRNLKKAKCSHTEVVCGDAVEYQIPADVRTFYFCNPCEYFLVEKMLGNIRASLKAAPRDGYIVYMDPRQFGQLDPAQYRMLFKYDGPGVSFHVYKVII